MRSAESSTSNEFTSDRAHELRPGIGRFAHPARRSVTSDAGAS